MSASAILGSSVLAVQDDLDRVAAQGIGKVATLIDQRETNDIILFGPRFNHYELKDRQRVWSEIVHFLLPDGHNDPVEHARVRGDIAILCRASRTRTYSDTSLWTTLYLNQKILPHRICFVLDKCRSAPLRIRLALIDVCLFPPTDPDALCAECIVDRIFSVISDTSHRWKSFYLHTEHPGAFLRVQDHCDRLSAPNMHSISLSYGHMPGYSEYALDNDIYDTPLDTHIWFEEALASLNHLELQSVYFLWSKPGLFRVLTTLDLSRIYDADWTFFTTLFTTADNLQFLRLDCLDDCAMPDNAVLFSPSLLVLDLGMDGSLFMSDILRSIVAPNLADLTLRDIGHRMYRVLRCGRLLAQLTRFAIFGLVLYDTALEFDEMTTTLFDSLTKLEVLDLHNTRADIFAAYRSWTYMRGQFDDPISSKLRALYIGYTPLDSLLAFFIFHGIRDYSDGSQMSLQFVRMKNLPLSADMEITHWFRSRIVDFGFLQPQNCTVSVLKGPAYHSLCCFAP
ncbi:hypothetical protein DFH06DRAFT_1342826 [Mycena polygramma]|nr:hypothetical protein DFH06DRAFT_1342826 [Mycena polygramma]